LDFTHLVQALIPENGRALSFLTSTVFLILLVSIGCSGEHQGPGVSLDIELPEEVVKARATRQVEARAAASIGARKQILFGDLHVHTTFSPDAFLTSLPMMGGSGLHPPADACDFARLCAGASTITPKGSVRSIGVRRSTRSTSAMTARVIPAIPILLRFSDGNGRRWETRQRPTTATKT
jgi:hypothetical protein